MRAMRLTQTSRVTITATDVNSGFLFTLPATTSVPRMRTTPMPTAGDDRPPAQVPPRRVLAGQHGHDEQEDRRVDDERDEDADHPQDDRGRAAPAERVEDPRRRAGDTGGEHRGQQHRERHAGEPAQLPGLAEHRVAAGARSGLRANIARTASRRAAIAAIALSRSTTTAMIPVT